MCAAMRQSSASQEFLGVESSDVRMIGPALAHVPREAQRAEVLKEGGTAKKTALESQQTSNERVDRFGDFYRYACLVPCQSFLHGGHANR